MDIAAQFEHLTAEIVSLENEGYPLGARFNQLPDGDAEKAAIKVRLTEINREHLAAIVARRALSKVASARLAIPDPTIENVRARLADLLCEQGEIVATAARLEAQVAAIVAHVANPDVTLSFDKGEWESLIRAQASVRVNAAINLQAQRMVTEMLRLLTE